MIYATIGIWKPLPSELLQYIYNTVTHVYVKLNLTYEICKRDRIYKCGNKYIPAYATHSLVTGLK